MLTVANKIVIAVFIFYLFVYGELKLLSTILYIKK